MLLGCEHSASSHYLPLPPLIDSRHVPQDSHASGALPKLVFNIFAVSGYKFSPCFGSLVRSLLRTYPRDVFRVRISKDQHEAQKSFGPLWPFYQDPSFFCLPAISSNSRINDNRRIHVNRFYQGFSTGLKQHFRSSGVPSSHARH